MNNWSLAGLGFALAASLLFYGVARGEDNASLPSSQATRGAPTPVKVLTAYTADEAPSFPGRVEAGDSAMLAFRVAGQLRELKVRMGNQVEKGAILAELDPTDYRLNLDARQAEFDLALEPSHTDRSPAVSVAIMKLRDRLVWRLQRPMWGGKRQHCEEGLSDITVPQVIEKAVSVELGRVFELCRQCAQ